MAIVTTDDKHYGNIAAAIREKTGDETTYKPEEMPTGVGEVYEAGKQAEYDRFWDAFQNNGNRTAYNYAFGGAGWTVETFKPKYNMTPTRSDGMFHTASIEGDLVEILENCGVTIDLSTCSTVAQTYIYSGLTRVGIQDTSASASLSMMFYSCGNLATIDKLILKGDGSQEWSNTFFNCAKLENIMIEGKIGRNGFNVSWSVNLTHDSLMSIINALQDKIGTGTAWTITLGTANLAKLTDTEKAIATQKGWTLA